MNGRLRIVKLGNGHDRVPAGNGNDRVQPGNGNNTVTLGHGRDSLQAGCGSNTLTAGNGNDDVQLGKQCRDWYENWSGNVQTGNNIVTPGHGNGASVSITGDVCGFAFDPHVTEESKRYGKLTVLPARTMNPDLLIGTGNESLLKS